MAISRLFIANRGEIAVRILRAAHSLGIETVLGSSAADAESLPARMAQRTVIVGPAEATRSYLDERLIVQAALGAGCDALHPGYGFLSERAALARLCEENGIAFVGPRPETIEALGDKLSARRIAEASGVPLVPGTPALDSAEDACAAASEIGYPVVMKATAGGGGRGMFFARGPEDVRASFNKASEEARAAFGDGSLYIERFVESARHVEVQVFGDGEGNVLHFGERDCSVQRRYQKLIEEAPCTIMPDTVRAELHAAAVKLTSDLNYRNAGTVEFLFDVERGEFYFIEVNARIQVEHPVSELISRRDLVAMQLRLAGGEALDLQQSDIVLHGHAIECRVNAEDPDHGFLPSPGRLTTWEPPDMDFVRLDTFCSQGALIPPYYDSMVGKLIVYGNDRTEALLRMDEAIRQFSLAGVKTNMPLQHFIIRHPDFHNNLITTRWLEQTGLQAFANREE
ncbi:MAG: ATP-grasp domain-containing protein [Halieaceae bacterium]|jgi:acetyl-CoA carboxylase biotin carboxylase subunit|uniref:acetyl-CoA carboxylase biotin carboxylase subunit n=1 Tax=Haliea alexandrii TaxID=2448162 RepID=UPI000F0B82EA|nr:biotin carboxylase N-terminal domain-containing protein [Haliea alexandrii]MCR9185874.1 ATP-grasp domain-containing protein [Halieaceae bacterium]